MNTANLKLDTKVMLEIPSVAEKFGINTSLRMAHFLAQCSHESGNFKVMVENLNYSAQGLANTWPSRFAVDPKAVTKVPNALANQLQRNPEKIANHVYSNRIGNGDVASGDGWKYRGRGYIQLTGKENYAAFDKIVVEDILINPDLVATKYPLMSAAFFFNRNGIWSVCDLGDTDEVVTKVTRRVNGGTNGLADRIAKFKLYKTALL